MTTSHSNLQLLEITATEAKVYAPMSRADLQRFIVAKFGHQPVSYFNADRRLYVIELGEPLIRPLSVRLEI